MTDPSHDAATGQSRTELLRVLSESGREVPVRRLIEMWGAKGRGSQVVQSVRDQLHGLGLTTEPPFEYGPLDARVRIVPIDDSRSQARATSSGHRPDRLVSEDPALEDPVIHGLHVGQIPSAIGSLLSVRPEDSLRRAQTLMIQYDFSQLVVIADGKLAGVISWESIARASLQGTVVRVSDCMTVPQTVTQDADLLSNIERIVDAGYVIVLDPLDAPSGIVTTADLAQQFDRLARPYLLVGECEHELRRILDSRFDKHELHKATKFKQPNQPGASAMTIGDMKHFIANPEVWAKMEINLSHRAFVDWIDIIRQIRNEIAHFSQDDDSSQAIEQVRNLTSFLRGL